MTKIEGASSSAFDFLCMYVVVTSRFFYKKSAAPMNGTANTVASIYSKNDRGCLYYKPYIIIYQWFPG